MVGKMHARQDQYLSYNFFDFRRPKSDYTPEKLDK